jgi:hypothetical protein
VTDLFGGDLPPETINDPLPPPAPETRYRPRSAYLPDVRQSYLHLPGVRPDRGPCPSCGAGEDVFCDEACDLTDPHEHAALGDMRRCLLCASRQPTLPGQRVEVIVLKDRPVRHLADGERTACRVVKPGTGTLYRSVPW